MNFSKGKQKNGEQHVAFPRNNLYKRRKTALATVCSTVFVMMAHSIESIGVNSC